MTAVERTSPTQGVPAEGEWPWPGYRTVPARLNIAAEVLGRQIERGFGPRPALVHDGGVTTYEELHRGATALAANLAGLGLKRGDLVLFLLPSSVEFAVSFLGTLQAGAIPVLVNSLLGMADLEAILERTEPRWAITESSRAGVVRALRPSSSIERLICAGGAAAGELAWESLVQGRAETFAGADTAADEPAFIVCTSGTTAKPKAIVHAHRWIVALGDLNRYRLPPRENDVVMATGEWSFISALGHNLLFPLRNGVTGAILGGRATVENILSAVERHRVTVLYSVATVYRRMLAEPDFEKRYDLRSLRCAHSTGEALREATYGEWKRRVGCELYEHYGVSEYQLVVGHGSRHPVKPGSVGRLLPGTAVEILNDDLRSVPPGELGHFAISTKDPGLFLGYYRDAARTEAAIRDGWYLTGDLAYRDQEGYFFIAGRKDDCFKSRGIFISPVEIENALQEHPDVIEAAVVPLPDREIGNRIRAVVVPRDRRAPSNRLAEAIRSHLRARLAPYKVPHVVEFADSLPKSPIGKILRSALVPGEERR
ncbi:MAG TPA: acyl-CoA synthetase [candidate division Zixibacteria bacterium]|nr:acyl-CoA synthetase [candidate division Zixibacteria bacterium]